MHCELLLTAPAPFDFVNTAYSHGWVVLAPNSWDPESATLRRVERLSSGVAVRLAIAGGGTAHRPEIRVVVDSATRLGIRARREITHKVGHMLRLDEDLTPFYRLCRKRGGHWRAVTGGMGRLLRSPSLWEDFVKVICTTNIQWGGTKAMVAGLVDAYGDSGSFPTPEAIAAASLSEFQRSVRLGYRAPYVHELATLTASGALDLETLYQPGTPSGELKRKVLALKGVGPYAAATLLMLMGRYDDLPVDTVAREFAAKKYFGGRKPSDAEVRAIYDDWGEWRFLAYWFDLWQGPDEKL